MNENTMSIAKALRTIKKLKGQAAELNLRLSQTTCWSQGNEPDFKFGAVREALEQTVEELVRLKTAVAVANATNHLVHRNREMPIAQAIVTIGELKSKVSQVEAFRLRSGEERERIGWGPDGEARYEVINWKSVMSEPQRVSEVSALREEIEDLNDALEEANHRVLIN